MKQRFLSPAKVNLILKVLSKRPDGYHNIFSLVDPISLYDTITIEELDFDHIIVKDDKGILPEDEQNTMFRAARLLKQTYSIRQGVRIYVQKQIPIGSGLGGPSSDAATVLKALSTLWSLPVSHEELMALGKKVGADVPLFVFGKSCIMEGIGDIITPVHLPPLFYVVVYPEAVISTKEVYGKLKIVLTRDENNIKLMGNFKNIGDIAGSLENDLEQIGITMCPKIRTIKDRLKEAGALGSLMSGSGSSVFGIFASMEDARKASRLIENVGAVFTTHSISAGRDDIYGDYGC
ncbi:MAG TPA: 4-(cytidine 5'-diphospho)-2-C-methyl-D-erythritol kinase [Syntrophorhabdaceae bacterium]|nr:4-(cytidine 5'-diphospho)-2-C-methyl-D-erythritol kinase [Syntrophorhabdaceae bacterium]